MKRLLKTSALLVIGLLLLASGFDAALDRMAGSATQSSFTVYSEKGNVLFAYNGDLAACKAISKPLPTVATPGFLHRT